MRPSNVRSSAGRGRPTAAAVAVAAGVSRSAVSRTFTPGASVAPATRAKVLAAAERLGYQPNLMARSLMTQRTHLVALVMTEFANPFFTSMLARFQARFRDARLRTLLVTAETGRVDEAIAEALQYQIDGIVLVSAGLSPAMAKRCQAVGVPVVVVDRQRVPPAVSLVWIDSDQVGREVAALFAAEGRTRPALVEGHADRPLTAKARAFTEHAGRLRAVEVEYGAFSYAGGLEAGRRLLGRRDRPDAIFCTADSMALGVLDAARYELGLDAPGDFSLVGFGDVAEAGRRPYRLSTVRVPAEGIVDAAVDALAARVEDPDTRAQRERLPCELVHRATTRPLPAAPARRGADRGA